MADRLQNLDERNLESPLEAVAMVQRLFSLAESPSKARVEMLAETLGGGEDDKSGADSGDGIASEDSDANGGLGDEHVVMVDDYLEWSRFKPNSSIPTCSIRTSSSSPVIPCMSCQIGSVNWTS